ncbi:hypothetical protein GCM10007875_15690 [Limnobacter litoralis]|uniref:HTH cro/C1-type domain-containing protein n=1 Tax=Limnobacter litoralis TaxID=481366 RepID=A0ABQ5YUP4_9BURK|nr:hypothetical protein GCM10007875_15690 [Limnobacter litoralis]
MNAYTAYRLADDAGVSVHVLRDYKLGCCSPRPDRLIQSFRDMTAMCVQFKTVTAQTMLDFGVVTKVYGNNTRDR